MCLITEQKEPLIAENDIVVYKVMESRLRSYFQYFQYSLNEVFESKIKPVEPRDTWTSCCTLDAQYLRGKYGVQVVRDLKDNPNLICIKYGFSSCESLEVCSHIVGDNWEGETYECIIPKGSEYYKDGVGFIVSNKIIINKLLK